MTPVCVTPVHVACGAALAEERGGAADSFFDDGPALCCLAGGVSRVPHVTMSYENSRMVPGTRGRLFVPVLHSHFFGLVLRSR